MVKRNIWPVHINLLFVLLDILFFFIKPYIIIIIISSMKMSRKTTLPQFLREIDFSQFKRSNSHRKIESQLKLSSESLQTFKITEPTLQNLNSQCPSRNDNHKKSASEMSSESQKIINKNYFTINMTNGKQRDLPIISSLATAHKMLIGRSKYLSFQEMNKENGEYRESLYELERQENAFKSKFKINPINVKSRKNIYEIEKGRRQDLLKKRESIVNLQISKSIHKIYQIRNNNNKQQSINQKSIYQRRGSAWKLHDFYDPLVQQFEMNDLKVQKMKQRLTILQKLNAINKNCQQIQYDSQTANSVQIFTKFSEHFGNKLIKKQRKLQKMKLLFA